MNNAKLTTYLMIFRYSLFNFLSKKFINFQAWLVSELTKSLLLGLGSMGITFLQSQAIGKRKSGSNRPTKRVAALVYQGPIPWAAVFRNKNNYQEQFKMREMFLYIVFGISLMFEKKWTPFAVLMLIMSAIAGICFIFSVLKAQFVS